MENKIKMTVYADSSICIDTHQYQHKKTNQIILPSKNPHNSSIKQIHNYMSKRQYCALLKRTHNRLFGKVLNTFNPYWVTLTLNDKNKHLDEKALSQAFHKFIIYVNRQFGKPAYIRALEYHCENDLRLHIHALLSFKDKPKGFTQSYIKKHLWKLGNVSVSPVYDFMGVIDYITIFKENNINPNDQNHTHFIKGSKIISMSNDFILGKLSSTTTFINNDTLKAILLQKNELEENGMAVRVDKHYFYNDNTQQLQSCIDRIFIRHK